MRTLLGFKGGRTISLKTSAMFWHRRMPLGVTPCAPVLLSELLQLRGLGLRHRRAHSIVDEKETHCSNRLA